LNEIFLDEKKKMKTYQAQYKANLLTIK